MQQQSDCKCLLDLDLDVTTCSCPSMQNANYMRHFRCSLPYLKGPTANTAQASESGVVSKAQLRTRRASRSSLVQLPNISISQTDTQAAIIQTPSFTGGKCYKPQWCPCRCKSYGTRELECKCETMVKWHCAINITGEFAAHPQRMTCGLIINTILACNYRAAWNADAVER